MRKWSAGSLLAVIAVAVAVAGCAGAQRAAAPAPQTGPPAVDRTAAAQSFVSDELAGRHPSSPPTVPAGFRLRQSHADHVALAFPPGWQALTPMDARFPGVIQTLGSRNRGLGAAVGALSVPDGPMKLLGFDPRTLSGLVTTASVMLVSARADASYAQWSAFAIRETRRLPSLVGRVRVRKVAHPLGETLRLEYVRKYGAGPRIATLQFVVRRGETTYIVTYSARPKLMRRDAAQFADSARTLQALD